MYESSNFVLDTVYIGGGTPSYLDDYLIISILDKLKETFIIDQKCEITIEMNPESVTEKKIQSYL